MPDERFIHPAEGESEKLTELSDFEFRVWIAYKVSANDVGVMLDSPVPIQTGNRNLRNRSAKDIRKALDTMLRAELLIRFRHQGEHYVCSPVWQDWQRVKHPRQTHLPLPDDVIRARCSEATRVLFAKIEENRQQRSEKLRNISEEHPNEIDRTSTESRESFGPRARDHARNANANALSSSEALKGEEPEKGLELLQLAPGQLRLAARELGAEWNARTRPPVAQVNVEPSIGLVTREIQLRPDMGVWQALIDRAMASDFLTGKVPGPDGKVFKLDFWWFLGHAHIIESGRYDNREKARDTAAQDADRRREEQIRRGQERLKALPGGAA